MRLVSIASVFWDSSVTSEAGITGGPPCPSNTHVSSGGLNSGPQICKENPFTYGAISPAQHAGFAGCLRHPGEKVVGYWRGRQKPREMGEGGLRKTEDKAN